MLLKCVSDTDGNVLTHTHINENLVGFLNKIEICNFNIPKCLRALITTIVGAKRSHA